MSIQESALIESKALRESVINKVEVLNKVKALSMLPGDTYTSVALVSEYYEVGNEAVRKIIKVHREELLLDGMRVLAKKELKSLKDLSVISKNTPSFTVLPRRAILRIGMLLTESLVAEKVRSYLLDVEEVAKTKAPEVIDEALEKQRLKEIEIKTMRAETAMRNAAIKQAKTMMQFARDFKDKLSPESISSMLNEATRMLTGVPLLPPSIIEKTYTAEQIGSELGISSNMVGKIANKHGLKIKEYGYTILGKSRYSTKQVPQWVYNENGRRAVIDAYRKQEGKTA